MNTYRRKLSGAVYKPSLASAPLSGAVPGIVAPLAAVVAPVLRMERPGDAAGAAASRGAPVAARALPVGELDPGAPAADGPTVQAPHGVLGVPGVLELDEREARRVPRHPDVLQRAVVREGILELLLRGAVAQVAHVDLAVGWIAGHLDRRRGAR